MSNKSFVIGDIHGNYKALKQCLEKSNFDYKNDILISLGDLVDGHYQSFEVIEELLKIKNHIPIKGNHDDWFNVWIETTKHPQNWLQGGQATLKSYCEKLNKSYYNTKNGYNTNLLPSDIPKEHIKLFKYQNYYYIDSNNNLFIHGGFNRHIKLRNQLPNIFWWDRLLWNQALSWESMHANIKLIPFQMKEKFNHIFIGHTSTQYWKSDIPMIAANITNLDQGAGSYGKLSIMNIDTREYFQSDYSKDLYPDYQGRN